MAYAPLPKLVPIGSPRVTADVSKAMYPDLLQSEPVQRLLNQPNIVIKPVTMSPEDLASKSPKSRQKSKEKRPRPDITMSLVDMSSEDLLRPLKPPACPLEPLEPLESLETLESLESLEPLETLETLETLESLECLESSESPGPSEPQEPLESLEILESTESPSSSPPDSPTAEIPAKILYLASKTSRDSGISLHPITNHRKKCGHCVPCENLICDVNVQQYVDDTGSSPMIATNIMDDEITAPVKKHCANSLCDALSIDHNRCRRIKLELNRFDKIKACDICGVPLKNQKTRVHHSRSGKCRRRDEYRHNELDGAQIRKERMREREAQMMEDLRIKRNEYVVPCDPNARAAETLRRNSELIVITKPGRISQPMVINQQVQLGQVLHRLPIVLQDQALFLQNQGLMAVNQEEVQGLNVSSSSNSGNIPENKFVMTSVQSQSLAYPVNGNEWVVQQGSLPQSPVVVPIRVLPIANLKSEPSMLHREQGIPRFCIISDHNIQMPQFVNVQAVPAVQAIPGLQTLPSVQRSQTASAVQGIQKVPALQRIQTVPAVQAASVQAITGIQPIRSISGATPQGMSPRVFTSTPKPVAIRPAPPRLTKSTSGKSPKKEPGQGTNQEITIIGPKRRVKYKKREKVVTKPFACTYCSKRFLTEWYFKVHVRKHKGQIEIKCEICEAVCTSDTELKDHIKSIHTEKAEAIEGEVQGDFIEEIVCDNCHTSFETPEDVQNHSCLDVTVLYPDIDITYEQVVEESEDEVEGLEALDESMEEVVGIEEEEEEDDGMDAYEGYEGLEEMEEMEEMEKLEMEVDTIEVNGIGEEFNGRINGTMERIHEEDSRKVERRKSRHSSGDEILEEEMDFSDTRAIDR